MSTGFEALPPRESGRGAKRRRVHTEPAQVPSAPASGTADREDATAMLYTSPIYADKEQYEYLDHTADVQIHSCTCVHRQRLLAHFLRLFDFGSCCVGIEATRDRELL